MKKIALLLSFVFLAGCSHISVSPPISVGDKTYAFLNPKKSAHYESNTPAHRSVLPGAPTNIVIDVNFDLAANSRITVMKDGKEYFTDTTSVDANKLAMRRSFPLDAPDGLYDVSYDACWPDGSCHDGFFQFGIDRSLASAFVDLRGKKEVSVRLKNIAFNAQNIRVNRGTKVVWYNDDEVEHYVNTDSHPAHTYEKNQNSKLLEKDDVYFYVFDRPGFYPYHCSAHTENMKGGVLVE